LLKLYPFKYRDAVSGIWTKARYKATLEDIRQRYTEWMIDGEPEIRGRAPPMFNPYAVPAPGARASTLPASDVELQPQRARPPAVDRFERFLVACLLRRYVTYCARHGRYAAMQGAAALLGEIRSVRP
jgi:hypothetical protein